MAESYNINRKLLDFLKSSRPIELKKNKVREILNTDLVNRFNPQVITEIKLLFADEPELPVIMNNLSFKEMQNQVGRTYGLFVSPDTKEGECLLLNVNYNNSFSGNSEQFYGSAFGIRNEFFNSFNYISKLIQENLESSYFFSEVKNKFELKLLTPLNDPVDSVKVSGHSIELPLAIAILSALLQKEIDISIACSGNINEDLKVTYVDGLEEKIKAAIIEYPEIKKFVLPDDCKKLQLENKFQNVEIIYVKNLQEGVEVFFPDFKQIINSQKFHGKSGLLQRVVNIEINDTQIKALEIKLDFDYDGGYELIPDVLPYFVKFISDILDSAKKNGIKVFLLNDFRPIWFIPALMKCFINKCVAVGVYYERKSEYIISYSTDSENLKLGKRISINSIKL